MTQQDADDDELDATAAAWPLADMCAVSVSMTVVGSWHDRGRAVPGRDIGPMTLAGC